MADAQSGGVDRRRVLAGIAWTTPAIVLAVGVPQAAASPGTPGGVSIFYAAANLVTGSVNVGTVIQYVGAASDAPVNPLYATILIPTANVGSGNPVVGTGLWASFGSPRPEGLNTAFDFVFSGSLTAGTTGDLQVSIPRVGDFTPIQVTVRAWGTSDGSDVLPAEKTVTTTVGAEIVFNVSPPAQRQTLFQGVAPAYTFYGQTRWNGPYWPVGADVTNIRVIARVPIANSTGVLIPGVIDPRWTLDTSGAPSGVVVQGDEYRVQYNYSGTIGQLSSTTGDLQFGIAANTSPPSESAVVTARTEGIASGSPVFSQFSGAVLLDTAIVTHQDSEYPTPGVPPHPGPG